MTGAVLFLGDLLVPQPTRKPAQPEPARTILWTSDLRDTTGGRATRLALKAAAHAAFEVCRTRPGIRHLVLAYRADSAVIPALHRRAPAVAIRLHAEIEQQAGRDVDVVLLDISDLDDPGLLHERLEELSRQAAGLAGAAALDWREIREESIRHAANSDYI